jgi:hypothetical protein
MACVRMEELSSDPLHTWILCKDVGRDDCSRVEEIRPIILQSMDHSKNTNGKLQDGDLDDMNWWRWFADIDR